MSEKIARFTEGGRKNDLLGVVFKIPNRRRVHEGRRQQHRQNRHDAVELKNDKRRVFTDVARATADLYGVACRGPEDQ